MPPLFNPDCDLISSVYRFEIKPPTPQRTSRRKRLIFEADWVDFEIAQAEGGFFKHFGQIAVVSITKPRIANTINSIALYAINTPANNLNL